MQRVITGLSIVSLLSAVACGSAASDDDLASMPQSLMALNGVKLNGVKLNGTLLLSTTALSLQGDAKQAQSGSDAPTSLVGTILETSNADGTTSLMRIDSVVQDGPTGMWEYGVSYQDTKGKWQPLCGMDKTSPVLALPLAGSYDETTGNYQPDSSLFTFACVNAALGKCTLWGYHPWETRSECLSGLNCKTQSLQPWHLACTRMVRADYCGNGVAHTRDGTPINIWDNFGILTADATKWELEAEWSTQGAVCVRHPRWIQADRAASLTDLEYVRRNCPERLAESHPEACSMSTSGFLTQYGYLSDLNSRPLLRNQSEGWLKSKGDAKN